MSKEKGLRELHRMIDPKAVIAYSFGEPAGYETECSKAIPRFCGCFISLPFGTLRERSIRNDNWAFLFVEVSKALVRPPALTPLVGDKILVSHIG
ncbi:hypothetical protein [Nostoc sp.]|uniref:hypothetical protein n=1 Tax=Nostoc sp. TaxID=1180 RepID=UPI002FF5F825